MKIINEYGHEGGPNTLRDRLFSRVDIWVQKIRRFIWCLQNTIYYLLDSNVKIITSFSMYEISGFILSLEKRTESTPDMI